MPTYRVTGPDGHDYDFDWNGQGDPTEQDLDGMFGGAPLAKPAQDDELGDPTGQQTGIIDRVFQTLGRPGAVVAGGINAVQKGEGLGGVLTNVKEALTPTGVGTWKETITGDDILKDQGFEQGWGRALGGLGIDIATDPLNLLGGTVAKAMQAGGKLAKVGRVADKVGDVASSVGNKAMDATGLSKVFQMRPGTRDIMSNAGDISYNDFARLGDSTARAANEGAEALAESTFKSLGSGSAGMARRKKIAHALDSGNLSVLDPEELTAAQSFKTQMDKLFDTQVNTLGNLKPGDKIRNYVQYLTEGGRDVEAVVAPALSSVPQSARKRQVFRTLQEAVDHGGATDDALEIMARSTAQVEKAKTRVEFLDGVATRFADPNGRKINFGNTSVSDAIKAKYKDVKVHPQIAQDIERAVKVWDDPTTMDGIYRTGVKLWKGMATSLVPGHHFTNFLGNIHNMYVAGDMSMKAIAKSTMMNPTMNAFVRATDDAAKVHWLGKMGVNNAADTLKAMKKYEVLGTSTQLGELAAEGTQKIVNNPAMRFMRQKGTALIEEPARIGLFLDRLSKGDNFEQAAIKVKNVLFDYSELTKTERVARDYGLIPFYTWMRKNIPLQMESMIKRPHRMEAIGDVYDVPWNANPMEDTVIPESRQSTGFVPTTQTAEGQPVMARFALPSLDLNRLGDPNTLIDSMGPVPKAISEMAMGRRTNGAPLRTSSTFARPSQFAKLMTPLNAVLPRSMEGYVTPIDIDGRSVQRDIPAWLTGMIPSGPLGNAVFSQSGGSDPLSPALDSGLKEFLMRFVGLTPDVITPNDQKFEMEDRMGALKRQHMRRVLEQ